MTATLNPRKGYISDGTASFEPTRAPLSGDVIALLNHRLGYDLMLALGAQRGALENFKIAEDHLPIGIETWPEYEE